MPNVQATPKRTVRIADDLWTDARDTAEQVGETVTDAITRGLRDYIANPPKVVPVASTVCPICGREVGRRGGGGETPARHRTPQGRPCGTPNGRTT